MPSARKRARNALESPTPVSAPPSAQALRDALTSRAKGDAAPADWGAAASAAGVSGTDAFLCHLGRSIVDSLRSVPTQSEAARALLRSMRAELHSAVDSRCDELEGRIVAAETAKVAALERELCSIDTSLELWRAERSAATEAAASLDDEELLAQHSELTARLDAAETQLFALPTYIVEPTTVGLCGDISEHESELLDSIADFGRVVAPIAVTPSDLAVEVAAHAVEQGHDPVLRFVLRGDRHASQSGEELQISLWSIVEGMQVEASLQAAPDVPMPLLTNVPVYVDACKRCVTVDFGIPSSVTADTVICVSAVTVHGRSIPGVTLPLRLHVLRPSMGSSKSDSDSWSLSSLVFDHDLN